MCVVGGGTAGLEAAAEASARGAEVTLIEKDANPPRPWSAWPELIAPAKSRVDPPRPTWSAGFRPGVVLVTAATRAGPGFVDTASGRVRSDFTILATGSRFERPGFQGLRKQGVITLDSAAAYEELGRLSGQADRMVVAGEGVRCLELAERLSGGGKALDLVISNWQPRAPSPVVFEVLSDAARESGVTIGNGTVTRALGSGALEAVLVDGVVSNCDALAFAPSRVPNVVSTQVRLGATGGALVDRSLRSSDPSTFAVGGCAEQEGAVPPATFCEEPSLSGRVAASNCLGDDLHLGGRTFWERVVFGIRWTRCGSHATRCRSLRGSRRLSMRWDRTSSCEILFEEGDGRIIAIETAEDAASRAACLYSPSQMTLSSLAYGRFGSSDITLVSDTARLALREWQRC